MVDIVSTIEELRQTGAQFLQTDLRAALTFTDIARTSEVNGTRERNVQNAAKAYASVCRLIPKLRLLPQQATPVEELRLELRRRLEELGVTV